ncbi:glycosyltransferase family 1 protein [Streptococcus suis]
MKILHIPTSGVNEGGITRFILRTMGKILQNENVSVHILSPVPVSDKLKGEIKASGMTLHVLPCRKRQPWRYYSLLLSYLRAEQFSLIHVHGSSALMAIELRAAKKAGIPVRIAHSHNITCNHTILNRLLKSSLYKNYNHALACSPDAGQWLFDGASFDVLFNGMDLQRFTYNNINRIELRKKLNIPKEAVILGHIGHFNKQKNHTFLLQVFKEFLVRVPQARLILIGSGKLEDDIRKQASAQEIIENIHFLGNLSDIERYYSVMDVFVLPSLFEGFSMVLAESQINGLPALTSTVTPSTVGVTSKVHYLALEEGPVIWANKILSLMKEDHTLSDEEKDAVRIFSQERISSQLWRMYKKWLKEST